MVTPMLSGTSILIVEDELIIALGLAVTVEDAGGSVIGPTSTVQHALQLIAEFHPMAAILDANLADRDVTPLALELYKRNVPFVLHSAVGAPVQLASALANLPIVMKPAPPDEVIHALIRVVQQNR